MTTKNIVALTLLFVYHVKSSQQDAKNLNDAQSWGYGILAGFGMSMIGFIAAFILVGCKSRASDGCFQIVIKFLFSLACGALVGDVMIHILPQAYTSVDPVYVSLIFILALLVFIIIDRLFHHFGIAHNHWHSEKCHDDHEGAIGNHDHPRKIQNQDRHKNCKGEHDCHQDTQIMNQNLNIINSLADISKKSSSNINGQTEQDGKQKTCMQNLKGKGSAGYLNLIGSFIHNFMDGIALGAAFGTGSSSTFIPVIIAIVAHQIPRQMGDVAILMTSKFSGTQTILCNGFINFMSLIGVVIGLAITNFTEQTQTYIMVFVAGNFMYIGGDIWRNILKNNSFCKNLIEFAGFSIGVGLMYVVLFVQGDSHEDQHGH